MTDTVIIGTRAKAPTRGFDLPSRTLTFVAATEQPCPAERFDNGEVILVSEILVATGCVNVGSMSVPLLDTHERGSIRNQLGRVTSAKVEGDTIVCTATLSGRPDVRAFYEDLSEGLIDSVSQGYTCLEETWDRTKTPIEVRVTKWRGDEVSLVPIPADDRAKIRAARAAKAAPTPTRTEVPMTPEALDAAFKAFGDSFSTGLAGFRAALTTTTPPAAVAPPVAAVVAAPAEGARATAATSAKPATSAPAGGTGYTDDDGFYHAPAGDQATARSAREDDDMDDESGDGDGTGGDAEERKRKRAAFLKTTRAAMGGATTEQFEALVAMGAPAASIRKAAFAAIRSSVGKPVTLTPPAATTTERPALVPFEKRALRAPAKVR